MDSGIDSKITENEVENIISKLRSSKARDECGFHTNFLKHYKSCFLVPVTHLINLSITQAVVPLSWKVAKLTPIYKPGDKTDPANYRPISILPIFSKIAEKWVANSIIEHLNDSNPGLHPMQFGFRTLHSTENGCLCFC
uniref:Reverse transcriptase domain-containing protein n=1 Tax=Pundamilia nyererei TaxID=303518 RepID=A0A3B4GQM8_9CICH